MNRDNVSFLRRRWIELATKYSTDEELINSAFSEIISTYNSPGRYYHNLSHIVYLLNLSDQHSEQLHDKAIVDFAIFYHDIVYDVSQSYNEERSAAFAKDRLSIMKVTPDTVNSIVRFILASKRHQVEDVAINSDLAWFLDFDLHILGSEWNDYLQYIQDIRKEYISYPGEVYATGRKRFLLSTMKMPFIFNTSHFRTACERRARVNIEKELTLL